MHKLNCFRFACLLTVSIACCTSFVFSGNTPDVIKRLQAHYKKYEKEVKDITLSHVTTVTSKMGELISKSKIFSKSNKIRLEMEMKITGRSTSNKSIIIFDGKNTWNISPLMGKQKLEEDFNADYPMLIKWWESELKRAQVRESVTLEGIECYVIEMHYRKGHPYYKKFAEFGGIADTMWIAKNDLRMLQQENIDSKQGKMLYKFSNFKGRWNIPFKLEMFKDGLPVGTSIIKSVRTNSGLSADLFNPDASSDDDSDIDMDEIRELLKQHNKQKSNAK